MRQGLTANGAGLVCRNADLEKCLPCDSCRGRKKKCFHTESRTIRELPASSFHTESKTVDHWPTSGPPVAAAPPQVRATTHQGTRESSPGVDGIGVYAPESILEDISSVTGPPSSGAADQPAQYHQRPFQLSESEQSALAAQIESRRRTWFSTRQTYSWPKLSDAYNDYLEDEDANLRLPSSTVSALLPLYICMLDDLIPVLDGPAVVRGFSNGNYSIYLVRAICLVTCKLPQAKPHLRLHDDGPILAPGEYGSRLLTGLEAAVGANLEKDRTTKVQILALMHLHNDGRNGRERSSKHLSSAINEAWAMALHQQTPGVQPEKARDMIWWSLRNLDRLSKPVMGVAPYFIDDADIGIDRLVGGADSYRGSLMEVSTSLGDLITVATKVHKASARGTVDSYLEFPSLAELTADTTFEHFYKPHRVYFEIWYHLAGMLSCKHGSPGSLTYSRRLQSAKQVVLLLRNKGHEELPPLPLVPYALSMATSVIYRALVDGQEAAWPAYQHISACCDALEDLSKLWTSAKGVSRLAKRLLKHIALPPEERIGDEARPGGLSHAAFAPHHQNGCDPDTAADPEVAEEPLLADQMTTSDDDFNNALLDVELGWHFGDHSLGNFQDMGTANFLDYLNMSYTEDENC